MKSCGVITLIHETYYNANRSTCNIYSYHVRALRPKGNKRFIDNRAYNVIP